MALVCGLGAARAHSAERSPLAGSQPARATVELEVRAIPRPVAAEHGSAEVVVIDVFVRSVSLGSERWTMRAPATLFARGEGWLWLEPGTAAKTVVSTSPGPPGERELTLSAGGSPRIVHGPEGAHSVAAGVRTALQEASRALPPPADALLPSMVLGDQRRVPPELSQAFLDSGLSHLAAVSGANIAYVLGAAVWLAAVCGAGRRTRLALGAASVAAFVLVVGPEPSVLRAAAMAAISVFALATGRSRDSLRLLLVVVLVFSIAAPATVVGLGFVLSVTATAGIVIAAAPAERLLLAATLLAARSARRLRGRVLAEKSPEVAAPAAVFVAASAFPHRHPVRLACSAIALALVAHASTAPVLAATGRAVPAWAIAKNIAVAPVVPLVTVAGTAAAAAGPVAPPLGSAASRALAWATVPALWWIVSVARWGVGGER